MSTIRHFATTAVLVILMVLAARSTPAYAQNSPPIVYRHFDTALALDANGHLHVRMVQQLAFDGSFSSAFFDIPTNFTTGIDDVQLYRAASPADDLNLDSPNLIPVTPDSLVDRGDVVSVEWSYPTTQPGDVRLFVIEYTARSVVWVYPDREQVRWQAVNADRSGIEVEQSTVSLTLPLEIPLEQVVANAEPDASIDRSGDTLTYTATEPLPDGVAFTVEADFPHGLLGLSATDWQADADQAALAVQMDSVHSDVTIEPNGDLRIQETSEFTVLDGALHFGFLSHSLLYAEDVIVDEVRFNGKPLRADRAPCTACYTATRVDRPPDWVYMDPDTGAMVVQADNAGRIDIDWAAATPIPDGETGRLDIAYRVKGALRIHPASQLLTWQVVPDLGLPVDAATLRLALPPGVQTGDVTVEGPPGQGSGRAETASTLFYQFDGTVYPGGWQIAVTLPAGATTALAPTWQADVERVLAEVDAAAIARARQTLIQRVLGLLALVGAALAGVLSWFRWGRRRVREALGGFVSEPPSALSPAIVEYLVDRKATENGVLGAIFHLATLGLLQVDLGGGVRLRRTRPAVLGPHARVEDPAGHSTLIDEHLRLLHDEALWPALEGTAWTPLDALAPTLRAKLPEIYAQLARDIQQQFIVTPAAPRYTGAAPSLWLTVMVALIGGHLLGFFGIGLTFVLGVAAAFAILVVGSGALGQRTAAVTAEQEADQWRRFRTYLADIKRYGDQGEAQAILDRYIGYAIAFGVVEMVLAQAGAMTVQPPHWLPSAGRRDRPPTPQDQTTQWKWLRPRPTPQPSPTTPGPALTLPSFAEMSARLGDSLRGASADMGALLQTAAGDADGAPRTVILDSRLRRRELTWQPGEPVRKVMDDLLRQGVADAREVQSREAARRSQAALAERAARAEQRARSSSSAGSSRSSGGFGSRSSSWSSSSSSNSSSRSSSSSSRSSSSSSHSSGGGGRSGFR